MAGYWGQPEATASAIRDGWLYTGDSAVVDQDGYLLIVDRMSDFIISGGENVSSVELENALLTHPSVAEAAVGPVPHENWGEVPKAWFLALPSQSVPCACTPPTNRNKSCGTNTTIRVSSFATFIGGTTKILLRRNIHRLSRSGGKVSGFSMGTGSKGFSSVALQVVEQ